ncbi:MAG: HD-GYP domain-containing protein [Gammaproteobacteria bacterium]|nr:MAG: HD-GYP domain-containing protein [Gammaproteobacteria bacterium]
MKAGALEYVVKSESVFADMPHTVESALRKWENILERRRAEKELERSAHMLRRVLVGTVQAMARMVETRDPYTAGHQRRVAHLAVSIATEMDLPQETIEGLQLGATIHDIGKNYIPAEILNRPGPLTDIEFELIKQHPQVGSDIVSEVDFPWPVAEMILQHHERMDGSGYPEGLSGDDIILEARILAVADVVEAMASHRPYRPACGMEAALAEIAANRAKAYDPEVADACLRLFKDRGYQLSAETYGNVETAAPIGVH